MSPFLIKRNGVVLGMFSCSLIKRKRHRFDVMCENIYWLVLDCSCESLLQEVHVCEFVRARVRRL